ncbi:MAG: extracellular solute-binding protein [Chloroflexi bacterium]|nr:extracellular solute-binding protein [Chloroflexota bacterium]
MFNRRAMFALPAFLLLLTAMLTTMPSLAQDTVTLVVWDHLGAGAEPDAPNAMQIIYDKFMEEHPNIVIQREITQAQEMESIVPTALASGQGPDVVYYDITPARGLFNAGLILPLDTYFEELGWADKLNPGAVPWVTMNGQFAGLPMESEFVGVFVNNDLFESQGWTVPTTLEETVAYCEAASAAGYVPFAHGQNPGWQTFFSFTMPLHNTVGSAWVEDRVFNNVGTWDDPGVVQSLATFYRTMRDAGCFDPDLNGIDWQTQQDLFTSGEAPLFPTGTWVVGGILQNMPDANVTMMPFPQLVEGMPRTYTVGMGSAWFVNASTEHPDEAAMLLDFIMSAFAVQQLVEVAGYVPPVATDITQFELAPLQSYVLSTLSGSNPEMNEFAFGYNVDVLAPLAFNTALQQNLQALFADEITPEEAAANLESAWAENFGS